MMMRCKSSAIRLSRLSLLLLAVSLLWAAVLFIRRPTNSIATDHRDGIDIRPSREAGPTERQDRGRECIMATTEARLKPGWTCVKRTRLERLPTIDPLRLLEDFYEPGIPVILTDLGVSRWTAFTEDAWAIDTMRRRYGHLDVSLQTGRASDPEYVQHGLFLSQYVRFSEFLDSLQHPRHQESNDYYITANDFLFQQPGFLPMLADISPLYPGFVAPESPQDPASGADIWMGPKGTVTPLHQDATSMLFTQVKGRKLWRLISPDQWHLIHTQGGISQVNLERPWDELVADFPSLSDVGIIAEVLQPGETLFLPNGWWHHVTSLDAPTISVSTSRWLPLFHQAEHKLHMEWSTYPWEAHLQG